MMPEGLLVGIKFCGGCHVSYERKELLEKIRRRYPLYTYSYVTDGGTYDYVLVLCCCTNMCADTTAYRAEKGFVWINHWLDEKEMEELWL